MLNFQYVLPFPTRIVASGIVAQAAGTGTVYSGTNGRQGRYAILVSNLDAANKLYLRTGSGVELGVIWPSVTEIFPISEDVEVWNPNGVQVSFIVGQLFLDQGNSGTPGRAAAFAPEGGAVQATALSPSRSTPTYTGGSGATYTGPTGRTQR